MSDFPGMTFPNSPLFPGLGKTNIHGIHERAGVRGPTE